jgi:hypothetical protein
MEPQHELMDAIKQQKAKGVSKKKRSPVKKSPFVKIQDSYLHHDALKEIISIIPTPPTVKGEQARLTLGFRHPYADRKIFISKPAKGEKPVDIDIIIKRIKTQVRTAVKSDSILDDEHEHDAIDDLIEAETAEQEPSSSSARTSGASGSGSSGATRQKKPIKRLASDEESDVESSDVEEEEPAPAPAKKKARMYQGTDSENDD